MKARAVKYLAALGALIILAGCQSIEGRYEPACEAYAGSRIQLTDSAYNWERFTDAIRIGDDGQPVDPFPDFPKRGSYERAGRTISLNDADGSSIAEFFLHEHNGVPHLLDAEQHAAVEGGGDFPECALALQ